MIVLLFVVSALTFIIFFVLPSADPAQLRAGRQPNPQLVEQIRHNLGLDRPKIVQYGDYMKQVFLHFDFGYS
jgi:peptide/nickel transport system permease protein